MGILYLQRQYKMTDTSPTTIPTHDSTKKLQGKVAIITGGASGIGEATAHLFADHGARAVVVADIQDDKGRLVAEAIGANRCSYVHCDVTDENQVQATVDWTVKTYGQLDIMFSNAGIVSSSDQVTLDPRSNYSRKNSPLRNKKIKVLNVHTNIFNFLTPN